MAFSLPTLSIPDRISGQFRFWLEKVRFLLHSPVVSQIEFENRTSSSNTYTLDRYFEATFTPVCGPFTTFNQCTGSYTVVGNICFFSAIIDINVLGALASRTRFQGLPQTSAGTAFAPQAGLSIATFSNAASNVMSVSLFARGNGRDIDIYSLLAAGPTMGLNNFLQDGTVLQYSGVYPILT
jgi:hypothetical protein